MAQRCALLGAQRVPSQNALPCARNHVRQLKRGGVRAPAHTM